MQDINQQLYEKKETPSEFIPVYAVVFTLNNDGSVICNKTYNEVKDMIKKGATCILTNISGEYIFNEYLIELYASSTLMRFKFLCRYDKGLREDTIIFKNDNTIEYERYEYFNQPNLINSYNIGPIISKILSEGTNEEVLSAINSIFTNFNGFKTAVGKPNSVFYNDIYGNFNLRANDYVLIFWATYDSIQHVVINEDGSYTHNTIQIVDQTLYRLSNLNIEPITNPKIWVGTSAQYAAIAEKDVNTTYIVKSE